MAEFAYNNVKHSSIGYMSFKLNCRYSLCVFYKKIFDLRFRSKAADELTKKLRNLIATYRENLQHAQELQKRAHDKRIKSRSYASSKKAWLNSKYIKNKRNQKLEAKFFGLFRVLHLVSSQAYKLKLLKQWRIHNVFHISLLEQDITRKGRVDEKTTEQLEFDAGSDNKEYEVEGIRNSVVYAKESEAGHLPSLYYLVS